MRDLLVVLQSSQSLPDAVLSNLSYFECRLSVGAIPKPNELYIKQKSNSNEHHNQDATCSIFFVDFMLYLA